MIAFTPDEARFYAENGASLVAAEAQIRPTTREELRDHVAACYGYDFPDTHVCEGHISPMEVLWQLFKSTLSHLLIIGSRESGKTLIFAVAEHLLLRWNGDEVFHGAGIYAQAQRCFAYVQKIATNRDERPYFAQEVTKCVEDEVRLIGPAGVEGKLEIKSATLEQLNGPHPRVVMLDEVELIGQRELDEAASMPHRSERLPKLPPVLHYTSSLKKAYGPMVRFLEEKEARGLTEMRWCVFEVIEQCPTERHQNGEGCATCPLAKYCREHVRDPSGEVVFKSGPGRAARARGWMLIDDVIAKMRLMSETVFRSQWLSLEPTIEGLIYPAFKSYIHVVDYEWNPNLPVYAGLDWGYTNPHAVLYAQQLYDDAVVIFAEDYQNLQTETQVAKQTRNLPWYPNVQWIACDPSNPGLRATFIENDVRQVVAADNDVDEGIDDVRWALESADASAAPMLYFDSSCVNTIREIKKYHRPEATTGKRDPQEKPEKIDDHAMDGLRYLVRRLFRARIRIA